MDDLNRLSERYLLGELDEAELEATELRLEDEVFFRRVQLAEDELIDAYLAGELDHASRRRFENHFLRAPSRRRKLEVSRMLVAKARQQGKDRNPDRQPLRAALAAAAVLGVAATIWILLPRQERTKTAHEVPVAELLVTLDLGVERGEEQSSFPLATEPRLLRLRIKIDPRDLGSPIAIVLRDARGEERWRGPAEVTGEAIIEVVVPSGMPAGAYEVEALAIPADGEATAIGYSYFDLEAP